MFDLKRLTVKPKAGSTIRIKSLAAAFGRFAKRLSEFAATFRQAAITFSKPATAFR